MKRFIILALVAIITFSSCRKDVIDTVVVNNTVKYTDEPPAALFDPGVAYGTITNFWIDSVSLKNAVVQYGYQYWYDNSQMTNSFGNYGNWRRVSVYVYWGRIDNVDYFSTGKSIVWMTPDATLKAIDNVNKKKPAIGSYCQECRANIGANGVTGFITWVQ